LEKGVITIQTYKWFFFNAITKSSNIYSLKIEEPIYMKLFKKQKVYSISNDVEKFYFVQDFFNDGVNTIVDLLRK